MSFSKNIFSILGDEETSTHVGSGAVHLRGTPKTASSTSSKKSDVDPRADPSKARPRAPAPPSNDRVMRESRGNGRANNRRVEVREGAPSHQSRRHDRTDRISRHPRRESEKQSKAGWETTEAQDEEDAEQDVAREEQAEAEEEAEIPSISYAEYKKQRDEAAQTLSLRQPSQAALDADARAAAAAATTETAPAQPREKRAGKDQILDVSNLFAGSDAPQNGRDRDSRRPRGESRGGESRESRGPRGPRGGARGGARGPRGGARSGARGGRSGRDGERSGKPSQNAEIKRIDISSLPQL